ncbi:citrate synthase [Halolamina pelagica]|uniref:Citrate synthase n=1 Tax=Halolamina pelagica TaxID=699431 RepID=A0A0P7GUY4_9EURY|nr:citrate synthase [Halolamina pelagica]
MSGEVQKGLEGVVVGESQLSYINGDEGRLIYRGHDIETLAEHATYEEVLYLLWHGSLPTESELAEFTATMAEERSVDDEVLAALADLAAADEAPMAALRTAVSMLSASDPEPDAAPDDQAATLRQGRRITAKIPTILATYQRLRDGEEPLAPKAELSHAGNFLYMLTGEEPDTVAEETLDMALILHADHGLNASTFSSMVIASTLADTYAAVTGGVGALSGPLHGGANQDVMETLLEVEDSAKDPVQWVKDAIDAGRKIPGFGHRVYNVKDPGRSSSRRSPATSATPPASASGTTTPTTSSSTSSRRPASPRRGWRPTSTSTPGRCTTSSASPSTCSRPSSR